jgi:hypothetical protein
MRMIARRATKVPSRSLSTRRARAALHLRSCAAERAVARRIAVARTSARLHGRTYRAPRFGEHDADAAFYRNPQGRLPRHGQRSLGCGSGSTSAPFLRYFLRQLAPLSAPRYARPSPGRFSSGLLCRSACEGGQPFAAPRFAHLIPKSQRRALVGLNQRFPKPYSSPMNNELQAGVRLIRFASNS